MDRRDFLALLSASVATALSACTADPHGTQPAPAASLPTTVTTASGPDDRPLPGRVFTAPQGIVRVPVPKGTLSILPGAGHQIALTVDDGTNPAVVGAYADLARITGLRLSFFVNGTNASWTAHAPVLRPLLEEGQIFLANHTWSHPDLTKLSAAKITEEVRLNETYLLNTYGVTGRPFLRPPYGYHNSRVEAQLADLGYPAVTMWLGSLGDATVITPEAIVANAEQWFLPQHLVIGHANHPPVMQVMGRLVSIIQERNLTPVHLGDIFDTHGA
jgi:peptidoglycan-N-acetylglucosamine deacetylase